MEIGGGDHMVPHTGDACAHTTTMLTNAKLNLTEHEGREGKGNPQCSQRSNSRR